MMYNLSVAFVATYLVGDGRWVVHNVETFDVNQIMFTQKTFNPSGKNYTVLGNVQLLLDYPDMYLYEIIRAQFDQIIQPIRIFEKEPRMNSWSPIPTHFGVGNPNNLLDGEIYTLDNRRLVAYNLAGRELIPIRWAGEFDIRKERYKFTTTNYGVKITTPDFKITCPK